MTPFDDIDFFLSVKRFRTYYIRRMKKISACLLLFLLLGLWIPDLTMAAEAVQVVVEGLQGRVLENVQAALRLPPGIVRNDDTIDAGLLGRFEQRIPEIVQKAVEAFGYFESRTEVISERKDSAALIRVHVNPGRPVRVTSVRVAIEGPGAEEAELLGLARSFPLKEDDILLSDIYEKAKTDLQRKARDIGYLDADFPLHTVDVYRSKGAAEIALTLDTGERYYFNGVTFTGTAGYPERFLRRFLSFKQGDIFSYSKLGQTRVNLYNADRFREVFLRSDRRAAKDHHVPVFIDLTPLPTKRIKTGVGYGTDTGARLSARYQDVNVMEKGHEFRSELHLSERLLGLLAAYIIPSRDSHRSFTALRLGLIRETPDPYQSNSVAFEVDRERSLGANTQGAVFVRFLSEDYSIGGESGSAFLIMPGVRLYGQHYDNLVRPQRGYRYGIEARGTDPVLGSNTGFLQAVPEADLLIPLPARLSLLLRGKAGFTLQKDAFDEIPVSLRFFAGGDRSVRGYSYQSLGPQNAAGEVVGGKHLLFGSVELERAVLKDWGIAAFFDAGNAFDSFKNMTLAESVGIGIRYYSKVGPLRLDIARQVNVPDPSIRLHFTIGIFI